MSEFPKILTLGTIVAVASSSYDESKIRTKYERRGTGTKFTERPATPAEEATFRHLLAETDAMRSARSKADKLRVAEVYADAAR